MFGIVSVIGVVGVVDVVGVNVVGVGDDFVAVVGAVSFDFVGVDFVGVVLEQKKNGEQ